MKFTIQLAAPQDEHFLWRMVYEAAHMAEAGEPVEVAQHSPALARYVAHWGQDHQVLCVHPCNLTGEQIRIIMEPTPPGRRFRSGFWA